MGRLMTAAEVVAEFGIPSTRTLATMRANGLRAVRLGKAIQYDPDDVGHFIESRKEARCRDQTVARISTSSETVGGSIFNGAKPAGPANAARALEIAAKLKAPSRTSSANDTGQADQPDRVIQGNFR